MKNKKKTIERRIREIGQGVFASYIAEAPDHGMPEVAVFRRVGKHAKDWAVVTRGEKALEVFETLTLQEALRAIADVHLEYYETEAPPTPTGAKWPA